MFESEGLIALVAVLLIYASVLITIAVIQLAIGEKKMWHPFRTYKILKRDVNQLKYHDGNHDRRYDSMSFYQCELSDKIDNQNEAIASLRKEIERLEAELHRATTVPVYVKTFGFFVNPFGGRVPINQAINAVLNHLGMELRKEEKEEKVVLEKKETE